MKYVLVDYLDYSARTAVYVKIWISVYETKGSAQTNIQLHGGIGVVFAMVSCGYIASHRLNFHRGSTRRRPPSP